ncbi:peptidase MA family metallohydrolase [Hazenella coriacea]|uniref:Peptidase MA-like domain-containing protein n=1 Tax=Hazenella coriacea TaxID=1179467 RepID=A0A4R3L1N7_9BACL|nr:hypothetical protein [Hazenella coriacea]TCS93319.1 hypothetical protein EDD58_108151 [Hazenella coriacea]
MNRRRLVMGLLGICLSFICLEMVTAHQIVEEVDPDGTAAIQTVVKQKEKAVNEKNLSSFMDVLHPDSRSYKQEQKRWFMDAIQYIDPHSYRLEVESIHAEKEGRWQVWVKQSYRKKGKSYHVKFPLCFEKTASGWKDRDLPFYQMSKGKVVVYYTSPNLEDQAHMALDICERASYALTNRFQWKPQQLIEVKLYHHPEVFRQSVKLSLPTWAGGWHEAGESIKLIGGQSTAKGLASGLVHELTHQMVSELTRDNASYWLQEGAAMYYEAHLLPGLYDEVGESRVKLFTVKQLESLDLEALDGKEAHRYYQTCYQLYSYLMEIYGEQKLKQVYQDLHGELTIDVDHKEKLQELNRRTRESFQKVLGKSMDQINDEWNKDRR